VFLSFYAATNGLGGSQWRSQPRNLGDQKIWGGAKGFILGE